MNNFTRLAELFAEFPGIGPRQAKRFVYFLLSRDEYFAQELARYVVEVRKSVRTCSSCFRFFQQANLDITTCSICRDQNRDHSTLVIVSRDNDLDTIEKSGTFGGYYFVLGGTVPILEKDPHEKVRAAELIKRVEQRIAEGLQEIIISQSFNPEGENTESFVRLLLEPLRETYNLKVSTLGRGLSTGTEIEYSDKETLRSALRNRF